MFIVTCLHSLRKGQEEKRNNFPGTVFLSYIFSIGIVFLVFPNTWAA